ncbi:sigma 54-interacting transcriptional regulator [Nitrosococcus oceani]|uniref:sigma 54-interacting transcriptional regulator n=1 Tax=Nitrosococcus oceani TaxID=1229 RepID=UPI000691C549|nr:sigma 54-interacting transcriptional regulator [Nitrosococcus oceani]
MTKQQCLSSEERDFFALLTEVIFSNPFSFQKDRLTPLVGKIQSPKPALYDHHYSALLPFLEQRIACLEARGIHRIQSISLRDRRLLPYAFEGATPTLIPFATELIDKLQGRGFSIQEAGSYLALFYQLRRAYFFITHSLVGDSSSMTRLRHAAINLSQFPESLVESELFGPRKGAFTGTIENHKGLFECCSSHGALFLDEFGDVSVPVQIKLPGQTANSLIEQILHTLDKCLPRNYAWPGNVRELEQAVRRIILTGEYHGTETPVSYGSWLNRAAQGELSTQELLVAYCQMLYRRHGIYEAVAIASGLDRRTAKKYVHSSVHRAE